MNCTFCNNPLPKGATSCPTCGGPVMSSVRDSVPDSEQTEQTTGSQSTTRCTSCGATLPAGTKFCPKCGANLEESSRQFRAEAKRKANAFWVDVEKKAKDDAKARRKGGLISWIIRGIGFAILAYIVWQIVS